MEPDRSQGAPQDTPPLPQLTRADLATMTPHQIREAQDRGQFADLLAGRQS